MLNTYNQKRVGEVLGNVECRGEQLQRTPLHVEFGTQYAKAVAIDPSSVNDKTLFNAVGSQCMRNGEVLHLPVLDLDGGATLTRRGKVSKAVINAVTISGRYSPASNIKDLLADHGIDIEVFTSINNSHHSFSGRSFSALFVEAIVLRTEQEGVLDAVASTNKDHAHLYINTPFSLHDHNLLLDEFVGLGMISDKWRSIAQKEGMAVVRTPWTKGELIRHGS